MVQNALGRVRYYAKRIAETRPSFLLEKARSIVRRRAFFGYYWLLSHSQSHSAPSVSATFLEMGNGLRATVKAEVATNPSYQLRQATRQQKIVEGGFDCLGYGRTTLPAGEHWHRDGFS